LCGKYQIKLVKYVYLLGLAKFTIIFRLTYYSSKSLEPNGCSKLFLTKLKLSNSKAKLSTINELIKVNVKISILSTAYIYLKTQKMGY